jgi:hypothetical protein
MFPSIPPSWVLHREATQLAAPVQSFDFSRLKVQAMRFLGNVEGERWGMIIRFIYILIRIQIF